MFVVKYENDTDIIRPTKQVPMSFTALFRQSEKVRIVFEANLFSIQNLLVLYQISCQYQQIAFFVLGHVDMVLVYSDLQDIFGYWYLRKERKNNIFIFTFLDTPVIKKIENELEGKTTSSSFSPDPISYIDQTYLIPLY